MCPDRTVLGNLKVDSIAHRRPVVERDVGRSSPQAESARVFIRGSLAASRVETSYDQGGRISFSLAKSQPVTIAM